MGQKGGRDVDSVDHFRALERIGIYGAERRGGEELLG